MKIRSYLFFATAVLGLSACKKDDSLTKPVDFTATTYQILGTYDSTGKPGYLLAKEQISSELLSYIRFTLPERTDIRQSNPELLTNKSIADITLTKSSDVFITYVSNGAGNANAIAFYTYPTNNPPKSAKDIQTITYVFPNAGYRTPLNAGDNVKIGRFEVGTSIGFVLMENAWNPNTKKLNNEAVHFCSNDVLNPEVKADLKKHAVMIDYKAENKVLIGFEDVNRTSKDCDHDFNDVVIYATVKS